MWFFKKRDIQSPPSRPTISVRMEAVGGQGANSAGKILAEAAVLGLHFTGNHFSSFGSEKRGSPVRSFVRFSPARNPIRSASFIHNPDLLVVFHENLLKSHPECLEGAGESTDLLINSTKKPEAIELPQGIRVRKVMTVDASGIARKNLCGLNVVLLGACAAALPEISETVLSQTIENFFSRLERSDLKHNLNGFSAGSKRLVTAHFDPGQSRGEETHAALPRLGWLNAPIGGLISNPGNTVLKDHSVSRKGIVPRLISDLCIGCGFCDMVCPDYCFVWEHDSQKEKAPTLKGIDYQYCKACQKCISICPVDALVPTLEAELRPKERNTRLYPQITPASVEEKWRNRSWEQVVKEIPPDARMLTIQTELLDPKSYIKPDFSRFTNLARKPSGKSDSGDKT